MVAINGVKVDMNDAYEMQLWVSVCGVTGQESLCIWVVSFMHIAELNLGRDFMQYYVCCSCCNVAIARG